MEAGPRGFVFSRRWDRWFFAAPVLVAVALLPLFAQLEAHETPLWAFVLFVVAFDVSHVWATLFRTYFDAAERAHRRALYGLAPPLIFAVSWSLHSWDPSAFWTIAAYFAIYHFLSQDYGFVALSKARQGERRLADYRWDRLAVWVGSLGPVLLWHASPSRRFDWFDAGEVFLVRLGPEWRSPIVVVYGSVATLYALRQLQRWRRDRAWNPGKLQLMALIWLRWGLGSLIEHPIASLAFINVFHGLPFIALVWCCAEHRWRDRAAVDKLEGFASFLTRPGRWFAFFAFLVLLGGLEELLWDGLVWRRYLPQHGFRLSGSWQSAAVALLALPQLLHYVLDGFIWRLDGSNPGLREALALSASQRAERDVA